MSLKVWFHLHTNHWCMTHGCVSQHLREATHACITRWQWSATHGCIQSYTNEPTHGCIVIYQWTRLTWREQSTDEGFLLQQSDTGRQIWFFCFPHKQFPQSTVWNQVNSLLLVLFNCKLTLLTCISLCSQMCPCSIAKGGRCLFPRPGPHWHQAERLRCCPSGHGCSPVPECWQVELLTGTVVHRHVDWFPARSWLSKE